MFSKVSYAHMVSNSTTHHGQTSAANTGNVNTPLATHTPITHIEISFESNLHPLFLQNVDCPGLILISKKFTGI